MLFDVITSNFRMWTDIHLPVHSRLRIQKVFRANFTRQNVRQHRHGKLFLQEKSETPNAQHYTIGCDGAQANRE